MIRTHSHKPRGLMASLMFMLAVALAVLMVVLLWGERPAEAAFPGANGKIAFERVGEKIFTMNPDGSNITQLTHNHLQYEYDPAWSPDGKKIALAGGVYSDSEIYIMDPNGRHLTRLTKNSSYESSPTWSPNGQKIAFDKFGEIYVMNKDGSGQKRLTDNKREDYWPDWQPIVP